MSAVERKMNKENETFCSGVNILDYVAPDELFPIAVEPIGCDSKNRNDSNEAIIQNALNSISNDCAVPIFVENERIAIEKVGNARREAKSVDSLILNKNNFFGFKMNSFMKDDYDEQGETSIQTLIFQEVKTQMLMKNLWIFQMWIK